MRELTRFQFFHRIAVSRLIQFIRLLVRHFSDLDLVLLSAFYSIYMVCRRLLCRI